MASSPERNRYHVLDARKLESLFSPTGECIDVTITSPPYWNIKDYGGRNQIGFGQSYDRYLDDIEKVFRAVYRATRRSGSLWLISDTLKVNGELRLLPFDIADRLKRSGWILQDIIIWQKDRTLPWSYQGKLRNIFEYITCFSKSHRFKYHLDNLRDISDLKEYWVKYPERYNPQGKAPSRSWAIAIPRQGSWGENGNFLRHACPLPVELVDRIVKLATDPGDLVFDPFAGSGSVLATASALGRDYLGVDLSTKYQALFAERVLPAVKKRYHGQADQSRSNRTKAAFASTILALRALKFPKELLRLYKKHHGAIDIRSMWVVAAPGKRNIKILFDLRSTRRSSAVFLSRAAELCKVKPLSKYGLSVELTATIGPTAAARALRECGLKDRSQIFLYRDGRFYSWHARGTLLSSLNAIGDNRLGGDGYPPLLSGLEVRLSPTQSAVLVDDNNDA